MGMSDYAEAGLRDHFFRDATFSKPLAVWIALHTADPTDAGTGTEVSAASYARVQRDPANTNWTGASATSGLTDNVAAVTFPTALENWGTITHVGIWDASFGGGLLFYGQLTTPKVVSTGDTAEFAIGALNIIFA